jgi:S1-C subfamily serine protease
LWDALSERIAELTEEAGKAVVAVEAGHRVSASGVHWKSGVVVTAAHLVRRVDEVNVLLPGGASTTGTVAGRDGTTDLAVVRVEESNGLGVLPLGSSVRLGELVLAVGRSRRGELAVAAGAMGRTGGPWRTWRGGQIERLLRPDVQLYPGQSGSALINGRGELLGINSAVLARASAITLPVETVDRVVSELLERGHISQPYLGLAMQEVPLPEEWQAAAGQDQKIALLVMHTATDSPAKQAGILIGDLIVSADGAGVQGYRGLHRTLAQKRTGDVVGVRLIRAGAPVELKVTLGDRPQR